MSLTLPRIPRKPIYRCSIPKNKLPLNCKLFRIMNIIFHFYPISPFAPNKKITLLERSVQTTHTYNNAPRHKHHQTSPSSHRTENSIFASHFTTKLYRWRKASHKIQFIPILIKISILNPHWNIFPNKFHFKDRTSSYKLTSVCAFVLWYHAMWWHDIMELEQTYIRTSYIGKHAMYLHIINNHRMR